MELSGPDFTLERYFFDGEQGRFRLEEGGAYATGR